MVENGFVCLSANRVPQFQQVMMIFHFPIKIASSAPPPCFWTNPSQVQQAFLQSQESWLLSWLELPGIWKGWTWHVFLSVWTCEVVNLNFLLYSLLMSNKKPFTPLSVKSRMSTFDGGADSTRSMLQPNLRAETCETTETYWNHIDLCKKSDSEWNDQSQGTRAPVVQQDVQWQRCPR